MKKIAMLLSSVIVSVAYAQFTLPTLPYSYEALEPYFDKATMEIHHSKHHATYVANLNTEVSKDSTLKGKSIEQILKNVSKYSVATRNNAGGHYNHSLFWSILTPSKKAISADLKAAIEKQFGSFDKFKDEFNNAAKTRFGSGWAWLIVTDKGELKVSSTPNQDNPLMDVAEAKGTPILGLDVWEHAYYLKYQNKRPDYIAAFWNIINWEEVDKRYKEATKK
jgi:Fe-Mn family superoxide dismutase